MLTRLPFTSTPLWRTTWRASVRDAPPPRAGLVARRAEPNPVGDGIKPRLEQLQQTLAGHALGACRFLVGAAELPLEQAVDAAQLLLLAQLLAVVGQAHAALLAVLAGSVRAPLDGALVSETFLALEEELLALPAAQATFGVQNSGHAFSLSTPAGASAGGSRCAAPASRLRCWRFSVQPR